MKKVRLIIIFILLILFSCEKDKPVDNPEDRVYSEWENYYKLEDYNTYFNINSLAMNSDNNLLFSAFIRRYHFTYESTWIFRLVHDDISSIDTTNFFQGFNTYICTNGISEKLIKMSDDLLFVYDKNENICCNWQITDLNKKHKSSKSQRDFSGNIWLASNTWDATDDGLQMFDGDNWTTFFEGTTFRGICFDTIGNLYACTMPNLEEPGIVLKYDYINWDTILICSENAKWISSMHFDHENNLWCGVLSRWGVGPEFGDGLLKFDGDNILQYNIYNSELPSNSVIEIEIDKEDNKWITMYSGGLAKLEPDGTWKLFNTENTPLTFISVEHVIADNDNNIWMTVNLTGLARMKE